MYSRRIRLAARWASLGASALFAVACGGGSSGGSSSQGTAGGSAGGSGGACAEMCGGACVDTATDGENCGACGHDCQGGACLKSFCHPVQVFGGAPGAVVADET